MDCRGTVPNKQNSYNGCSYLHECLFLFFRLNTLPATAPAINWSLYENRVPSTMLAEFKKQYEVFTVPYPADSYTDKIVAQEKTAVSSY